MKRFVVFTVMLAASMFLSSCLSFTQATVNPGATPTAPIPETGAPSTTSLSATPISGTGENQSGSAVDGTFVPFLPDTGEFSMEGTPEPLGNRVFSPDGQVFPYAASPFPGLGTSAAGTPEVTGEEGVARDTSSASDNFIRLTQLQAYTLSGESGDNLSSVTDFVISLPESRIKYLVVETGSRSVLVPWEAAAVDTHDQTFRFNGPTDQFNAAPEFDLNGVDFNQPSWEQSFQQFWGSGGPANTQTPGSATQSPGSSSSAILASRLFNVQVVAPGYNPAGTVQNGTAVPNTGSNLVLGQVQDALVSQSSGAVPWLLISANNNFINLNNRLIPIPFAVLGGNLDINGLMVSLNQGLLSGAPNLDATNLPNIFGGGWDSGVQDYWQKYLQNWFQSPAFQPTPTP